MNPLIDLVFDSFPKGSVLPHSSWPMVDNRSCLSATSHHWLLDSTAPDCSLGYNCGKQTPTKSYKI